MNARVNWSVDDGVGEIVLNGADRANAMDLETTEQLRDAVRAVSATAGLRGVLLRSEGRHFCVGGDLRAFDAQGDGIGEYVRAVTVAVHEAMELIRALEVPVVVAVQGAAAGAGVGLALSGDLTVLADNASFKLAYTSVGLSPDNGSSYLLPRMLGERRALDLMLTNRTITAQDALAMGLATSVVEPENLEAAARELIDGVLQLSTDSVAATKRLVRGTFDHTLSEQLELESDSIVSLVTSPYGREAVARFARR